MSDTASTANRTVIVAGIALAAITVLLYLPVLWFDFVSYDDPLYVTANKQVQQGLTPASIKWAFELGPGHAANYHPLTLLSHMLDVQLFGLRAGLHHLTSVILHAAAAVALLWFFYAATRALWASFAIAALFAWHPMHVESVAWVAERKDVLSGLMFCLMLVAYERYARRPSVGKYLCVAGLLALGLLAKPMLVTAPFVLLLVDRYPLRRSARFSGLLLEKLPMLTLCAASAWITFIVQRADGAMRTDEQLPLQWRLLNVPVAYVRYLLKLICPTNLSVFYPYQFWGTAQVIAASALLIILTIFAFIAWRRGRDYPLVGWLWFLGMLVPVIGIVQVGAQSMADRYSYLPSIGVFAIIGFAANEATHKRRAVLIAGGAVLIAMLIGTSMQLRHWRNDLTLFQHAAAVTEQNSLAEMYVGKALGARGDVDEAIRHFDLSLEHNPTNADAHYNLGNLRLRLGQAELAANSYRQAITHRPKFPQAYNNLAVALAGLNDLTAAEAALRTAIDIDPEYPDARASLGRVLLKQGRNAEAAEQFENALRLDPTLAVARRGLAESQATTRP